MLCRITIEGVETYCSDLIIEREESVCFLSVAGHQTAVKATVARLLTGWELTLVLPQRNRWVQRLPGGYRRQFKKLPSGYCQATATTKLALFRERGQTRVPPREPADRTGEGGFLQPPRQRDGHPPPPELDRVALEPLPEEEWIKKLTTLVGTKEGYLVRVYREALMDRVAAAMREKVPDVISCMQRR